MKGGKTDVKRKTDEDADDVAASIIVTGSTGHVCDSAMNTDASQHFDLAYKYLLL